MKGDLITNLLVLRNDRREELERLGLAQELVLGEEKCSLLEVAALE